MNGLVRGDSVHLPLADESVDLVVTSPPYFALRSYQDKGEHYDGQIGSEPTPAEFLDALWAVTAECVRVLKPSGSIWVNLGDKYLGSDGASGAPSVVNTGRAVYETSARPRYKGDFGGVPTKSLMGLPWRYAIGCIDQLDLILRAEVIWCLSGGAKVYARINGKPRPVMVRDLARAYQPEDVQLWNGDQWTQALGWNRSPDSTGAVELELRSGERIGCTLGHQWPTARGLVTAADLEVGDVIDTTRLPEGDRSPLHIDSDVGWLVGLYIAEGSRSGRTIQIAGHVDEKERLERLERIALAHDGECHVYTDGNTANITLSGSVLVGLLERYVTPGTAHTKRLTMHAWQMDDPFLRGVVDGYLSGDGHHDELNDRWRLGFTDNDEWASDLRTLAARLGATLTLKRATHQGFGREWPGWRGEWRDRATDHHNSRSRSEVVAIRASRARQFFDIGVADEPHTFALASGVLTHNSKPNGLPESVTDRVRRSHEQWFHFTKEPRYYSAVDEIRESYHPSTFDRHKYGYKYTTQNRSSSLAADGHMNQGPLRSDIEAGHTPNPLGKLPGSVWTIPTEPLRVPDHLPQHFAAFPSEWPRRIILGWSPSGVCVECGEGRRPEVEQTSDDYAAARAAVKLGTPRDQMMGGGRSTGAAASAISNGLVRSEPAITGYSCACPTPDAPTRPAIVLDPFAGTGTTVAVANHLGRYGIGVDLSADYLRLARWRIHDPALRAKVLRVDKPPEQIDGQGVLL